MSRQDEETRPCEACGKGLTEADWFISDDDFAYCFDTCADEVRCRCGKPKAVNGEGEMIEGCRDCLQALAEAIMEGER